MSQGKNMKQSYTGMKKGLSLMEMLISIVLFGAISTIGYVYYKNYYDTSRAAKEAKMYVLVDQATQLSNAYDLYAIKYGVDANNTQELLNAGFLTGGPIVPQDFSNGSWELNTTMTMNDTVTADDVAFTLDINTTTLADELTYCQILNGLAYKDWNSSSLMADQNTSRQLWYDGNKTSTSLQEYFHCAKQGADKNLTLVFVKKLN